MRAIVRVSYSWLISKDDLGCTQSVPVKFLKVTFFVIYLAISHSEPYAKGFFFDQAAFGFVGLLDDIVIFLLLSMYLTTIFR